MSPDLAWERPAALLLALVPLVLLLLGTRRGRPVELGTGTFELWRELAPDAVHRGARRRPLPPSWLLCLAGGLLASVLALAAPVRRAPPSPRLWQVVVEPGPALALPWVGPDGATGASRLERALDQAGDWLAERRARGDEVEWWLGAQPVGRGTEPPRAALTDAALHHAPKVALEALDRPGRLLLLARRPASPPTDASWIAVGGGAVPGPVAPGPDADGRPLERRFDGRSVLPAGPAEDALVLGPRLPAPLAAVARAWAASRALRVLEADDPAADGAPVWLRIDDFRPAGGGPYRVGRDGWAATVGQASSDADGPANAATGADAGLEVGPGLGPGAGGPGDGPPPGADVWLAADGVPLAVGAPGRVWAAALAWSPPEGPPAAFALSVGSWLDALAVPPHGRASVADRLDQGPPGRGVGRPPEGGVDAPRSLAAAPALVGALLLALAGALLRRRTG